MTSGHPSEGWNRPASQNSARPLPLNRHRDLILGVEQPTPEPLLQVENLFNGFQPQSAQQRARRDFRRVPAGSAFKDGDILRPQVLHPRSIERGPVAKFFRARFAGEIRSAEPMSSQLLVEIRFSGSPIHNHKLGHAIFSHSSHTGRENFATGPAEARSVKQRERLRGPVHWTASGRGAPA